MNFSLCEFTTAVPFQGDMNFHAPHVDGNSHPMWPSVLVRNFHRRTQKCEFCVFSPTSVVLFETRVTLGCNLQRVFRIRVYLGQDLCVHVINNECYRSTRICEFIVSTMQVARCDISKSNKTREMKVLEIGEESNFI